MWNMGTPLSEHLTTGGKQTNILFAAPQKQRYPVKIVETTRSRSSSQAVYKMQWHKTGSGKGDPLLEKLANCRAAGISFYDAYVVQHTSHSIWMQLVPEGCSPFLNFTMEGH